LAVAISAAWFLTGDYFRNFVRGRVVNRIEEASGGRVELKDFRWNLTRMEFEADGLTIHGNEKPGDPPFVHIGRILAQIKVNSIFRKEIDLRTLTITDPSIHIIVYPDGTTNQPVPKVTRKAGNAVQSLFDLAIGSLQLEDGELLLNEQRFPLDFQANDVGLGMKYDLVAKRFDGSLHFGRGEAKLKDWRPLPLHGDVSFSLYQNRAELKSVMLASGQSRVDASGTVRDFATPQVDFSYKAHLETRQLTTAAQLRSVSGGQVDLNGRGRWSRDQLTTSGDLRFHDLLYSDSTVRKLNVSGSAQYTADYNQLSVNRISARIWDGTATGNAVIQNWLGRLGGKESGSADLVVSSVQLQPAAASVSTSKLPLDRLNLAGESSGTVAVTWKDTPRDIVAKLDLRVTPLAVPQQGQLPVSAKLHGTFRARSESLQFDLLDITTPNTTVVANGTLGSESAHLNVSLDSRKITEFQPIIDAIAGPDSPLILNSIAKFQGTVAGRIRTPSLTGHIELRDFSTVMPRNFRTNEEQVLRWDSLSGELRFSTDQFSLVHATLQRGPASMSFDGEASLDKGKFTDASVLTLHARIKDGDIADLQKLVGYQYPVTGRLNASLQVSGPRNQLRGAAHVEIAGVTAYGEPIRTASADFRLSGNDIQATNAMAIAPAGEITGTGAINYSTSKFRLHLRGTGLRLQQLQILQKKRINVEGLTTFEISGEGTPQAPVLNASIQLRKLVLSGEQVGDMSLTATTRGEDLNITGRSDFLDASLGIDGFVRLRGDFPAHIILDFKNLDADPLIRGYLKQFRLTSHTLLAGHFQWDGSLRRWQSLTAEGSIYSLSAGIENVKIANEGPIHFALSHQTVTVENLHLVGEETNFNAGGTIGLAGPRPLDLRANGSLNLRILQSFSPEYTASGTTTLNMRVAGSITNPQLRGRIQIQDGAISYVDLPNGLSGINGSLFFTEDRLQVQNLTARTGGGELVLGGFIAYSHELTFDLTAHGKDIRLRYPPGISSSGDANLTLAGTPKNALLSGEITVTRFGLNPRFDFASYLAQTKQPQAPVRADSPLNGLRMDVHVISTPELQVQTSLAKITGNVDLHLRGTAAKPVVLGRVNIVEGDLTFNSTTYHLERGEISFTNPTFIQPVLDIEATAHVRDYDITLGFHGPADHPSTNYRSDPPLPTADIIALLALGRTRQESAQAQMYNPQQTTVSDSASNELLSQALNATVSSRVQKLFGVSRIKIDPQMGGPENNPNARLTIEQQVSDKVTLTYITNLSQSAQQIIQFEYNITRDVSILAVRDQTGVVGFDVRIRRRKK
jgi:translocation and assembly module TamB